MLSLLMDFPTVIVVTVFSDSHCSSPNHNVFSCILLSTALHDGDTRGRGHDPILYPLLQMPLCASMLCMTSENRH